MLQYKNLKIGDRLKGKSSLRGSSCTILSDHGNGYYGAKFSDGSGDAGSMLAFYSDYWDIIEKEPKKKVGIAKWFNSLDRM